MDNNIISFDYDGTLDDFYDGRDNPHKKQVRDWAIRLIRRGYKIYIITRRYGPGFCKLGFGMEHIKVFALAQELGIPRERIIFTNREWKYRFVNSIGGFMHFDDDNEEIVLINQHTPHIIPVYLGNPGWEEKLVQKIEPNDHVKIWISNEKNLKRLGIALAIALSLFLLFS